jgi:CBS domain-containing protein
MKVQDVMTPAVVTVGPDTPFKEVVETLLTSSVSGVPVVDEKDTLIGMVTEADLLPKEAYGDRRRKKALSLVADVLLGRESVWIEKAKGLVAGDVMSRSVVTVTPEENVRVAARRMIEEGVKRLPVVSDGRLVGIVSRPDLLSVFSRRDDSLAASIRALVRRCMYVEPDYLVEVSASEGVVTLEGIVRFQSDVDVLAAIVGAADGVVGVDNKLRYREKDAS